MPMQIFVGSCDGALFCWIRYYITRNQSNFANFGGKYTVSLLICTVQLRGKSTNCLLKLVTVFVETLGLILSVSKELMQLGWTFQLSRSFDAALQMHRLWSCSPKPWSSVFLDFTGPPCGCHLHHPGSPK